MRTIAFLVVLMCISFVAFAQEEIISEAVSSAKPVHLVAKADNVKEFVKQYVENAIAAWQQRGEFEKTSDYQLRVTPETRKNKADELADIAFAAFKKAYIAGLKQNDFVLGDYDADNETFLVRSANLGDFVIQVPIAEAPAFKNDFYDMSYSDYDFYISNDKMQLAKLSIVNRSSGVKYVYNSQTPTNYVVEDMVYNFEPIDVSFDAAPANTGEGATIAHKTTNVGNDPVDINIPETQTLLNNTFVLVIGNENYTREQNVPYAINDARIFAKYMEKTFGIPANRITLLEDATLGAMIGAVDDMKAKARTYNGEATLIVYYAGHGMPDNATKEAYLLPVDASSSSLGAAYSLNKLYLELTEYSTEKTIVFLDACFSGDSRDGMLASGRGLSIEPNKEVLQGKLVVFSATTGKQTAHPYNEKGHGLFTYFLLTKLQETGGNVSFGDLYSYLSKQVSRTSLDIKNEQTPDVNTSPEISGVWQNMKF
jgi:hypothetical protein